MTQLATTLTASDARINLYDMLEEVRKFTRRFTITHRGKPQAILMPIEEVESWEETLEIMADKKLMTKLKQAKTDIKAGRVYPLADIMKELGINEH